MGEDIEKGKRSKRTRMRAKPGHRHVPGICDLYHGDNSAASTVSTYGVGKSAAQMAASAATAHGADSPSVSMFDNGRHSEPLGRDHGHQAVSSGDHNTGTGRNTHVAYDHPDLRQSNVNFTDVLARLSTVRGNTVDLGVPDTTAGGFSHAGEVALNSFQAANQAGSYRGMMPHDANPVRPDYHQERQSRPNGSHSLSNPESKPMASTKSRVDIMREALFGA